VNEKNNIAYISNDDQVSNHINLVGTRDNNYTLLAGVRFKVNLPDSANITCYNKDYSNHTTYKSDDFALYPINSTVHCSAAPVNSTLYFSKWEGFEPMAQKSNATFTISHFGTLALDLGRRQTDDIIQKHYSLIVGLLTATIVGPLGARAIAIIFDQREKKRQLRYLRTIIPLIDDVYKQNYQNKEKCLNLLQQQKKKQSHYYKQE